MLPSKQTSELIKTCLLGGGIVYFNSRELWYLMSLTNKILKNLCKILYLRCLFRMIYVLYID